MNTQTALTITWVTCILFVLGLLFYKVGIRSDYQTDGCMIGASGTIIPTDDTKLPQARIVYEFCPPNSWNEATTTFQ